MPVHERIYSRLAHPPRTRGLPPALGIGSYGTKYALKGWFTRLVLFAAFVPGVVFAVMIYAASQNESILLNMLRGLSAGEYSYTSLAAVEPEVLRRAGAVMIWYLIGIQSWIALLFTPLVGSHQIADDLRSHAFEVYLARPITSWDYLAGKLLAVAKPLLIVSLLPVLAARGILNLLIEGTFGPLLDLYPRVILATTILAFVNSAVILGISSLGKSSRYATVMWFALNLGSLMLQGILIGTTLNPSFDVVSYGMNAMTVVRGTLDAQLYDNMDVSMLEPNRGMATSLVILLALAFAGCALVLRRVRSGRLP